MPAFVYDAAMAGIASGTINLLTDSLKLMLCTSAYSATKADTSVTPAAAAEIVATNYAGGFGGAGRMAAGRSIVADTSANIVRMVFSGNTTWTSLGGATNATIAAAVLIKEVTNDAGSKPIAYFPLASAIVTTGTNFVITVDGTSGNITFTL